MVWLGVEGEGWNCDWEEKGEKEVFVWVAGPRDWRRAERAGSAEERLGALLWKELVFGSFVLFLGIEMRIAGKGYGERTFVSCRTCFYRGLSVSSWFWFCGW